MSEFITLFIPFAGTTLGAAMVFFMKDKISPLVEKALLGFAAGVMIAASIWSLLIPSIDMAEAQGKIAWLPALIGFALGIIFLLVLDTVIPHLHLESDKPEGVRSKLQKTTMMIFAVTLHNIPEGMAVSVPLINGGMSRVRAVAATAACGLPTVLGAWLGYWLGDIGPLGLSLSLGFASGAMLYVVFGEIIPQSVLMYRSKLPTFFVIVGILLGLLIIYY